MPRLLRFDAWTATALCCCRYSRGVESLFLWQCVGGALMTVAPALTYSLKVLRCFAVPSAAYGITVLRPQRCSGPGFTQHSVTAIGCARSCKGAQPKVKSVPATWLRLGSKAFFLPS